MKNALHITDSQSLFSFLQNATKLTFVLVICLTAFSLASKAGDNGKQKQKSTTTEISVKPAVTLQMLMEENQALRKRLEIAENNTEDNMAKLAYTQLMGQTILSLQAEKSAHVYSDLKAEMAFNNLMTTLLKKIDQEKNLNSIEDMTAQNAFMQLMSKMLQTAK